MSRSKRFLHITCLAMGMLFIGGPGESLTQQLDRKAPDFSLPDRSGNPVSLKDFRGQVILLDFWASWCGPCRRTMPKVQQWYDKYQDEGLMVVGVNIEGASSRAFNYIDRGKYSFLVLYDKGNWGSLTAKQYGVTSIPHTFLIDRRGIVRYRGHPLRLPETYLQQVLAE